MQIKNEKPPIWDEAQKHFDIDHDRTVYTYGDTIYNPAGLNLPQEIVEHESVHMEQQSQMGPEAWWRQYFENPDFRFHEEAEAYRYQHYYYCTQQLDRNKRARHLHLLASILSSSMYKTGRSQREALEAIRGN